MVSWSCNHLTQPRPSLNGTKKNGRPMKMDSNGINEMRSVNYKNILILKHFTEHLKPGYQIGNDIPLSLLNPGENS